MLSIKGLKFSYNKDEILKDINFSLENSKFVCILGPNGSGKTTLIKCINKILDYKIGEIHIEGLNIKEIKREKIAKLVSYVPQMTNSFFRGTVIDLLVMAAKDRTKWAVDDSEVEKSLNALNYLGIEELSDKNFQSLSGGQKQKVLIAKALVEETKVYLLDEPTSFLDIKSQIDTMKIAKKLSEEGNLVIMIVHDLNLAFRYADEIILMKAGKIKQIGTAKEVLSEGNILDTYGVEVEVKEKYILPV